MSDDLENPIHSQPLGDMSTEVQSEPPANKIILEDEKIKNKSPSPECEAEFFDKSKNSEIALE